MLHMLKVAQGGVCHGVCGLAHVTRETNTSRKIAKRVLLFSRSYVIWPAEYTQPELAAAAERPPRAFGELRLSDFRA